MKDTKVEKPPISTTIELHGDEFWSLSGKPYFHKILTTSHVKPKYHMVIPAKMNSVLHSRAVPVILTCKGKKWQMNKHGVCYWNLQWKQFIDDNGLNAGDACVFELVEYSDKSILFRGQILRGDIPSKFLDKANGESADNPVIVE
ncbi:B3 domain-containing protein [Cephalotus follicularis]|uniref:B3 domain-containing protein n=1 Tax=Cephalotus follicularis TaxID=3775 RepID=A0A1Q3BBR1_CEPFO|nr:B3 domain-containing protein [Cephalotus follicularis]